MIEKIPFIHRERMYNIILEDDITFEALHYILDMLIEQGAFAESDVDIILYTVSYEEMSYTAGVDGIDVMLAVN